MIEWENQRIYAQCSELKEQLKDQQKRNAAALYQLLKEKNVLTQTLTQMLLEKQQLDENLSRFQTENQELEEQIAQCTQVIDELEEHIEDQSKQLEQTRAQVSEQQSILSNVGLVVTVAFGLGWLLASWHSKPKLLIRR